jgi:predicted PurR-regulated permease PerM
MTALILVGAGGFLVGFGLAMILIGQQLRVVVSQRDRALEQAQRAIDGWKGSMHESAEALLAIAKARAAE